MRVGDTMQEERLLVKNNEHPLGRPETDGEMVARLKAGGVANNYQVQGDHYHSKKVQPWDFIIANGIGFLEGNAIKYLARWKDKRGINGLLKAKDYIEKLIEVEQSKGAFCALKSATSPP